jgi:hypothetical protein
LRLRHGQRIEGFSQQLDTSLCHQVSSEQLMERSAGRGGARVRHILGEGRFWRVAPSSAKSDAACCGSRIEARYPNSRAFESFIVTSFAQ